MARMLAATSNKNYKLRVNFNLQKRKSRGKPRLLLLAKTTSEQLSPQVYFVGGTFS